MSGTKPSAFYLLILGDFSGRANRGIHDPDAALRSQKLRRIDCDNFEEVFSQLSPSLDRVLIAGGDESVTVQFQNLDQLHPDELVEQVKMFESLRSLRRRLLNPTTFADAAKEVYAWHESSSGEESRSTSEAEGASAESATSLLDQMLEQASSIDATRPEIDFQRIIQQIVAPYMPQQIDPRQDELVTCVDAATETLMAALLHHPHFQQLEAAWRGLDFLIRRVELDVDLKIYLLDVTSAELADDLMGVDGNQVELPETRLHRLLVEQTVQTPGGVPWSLVASLHPLSPTESDLNVLEQLARTCCLGRARLVVAAAGHFVGCTRPSRQSAPEQWTEHDPAWMTRWQNFRRSDTARGIALVWPRFLLRLPYGAKYSPVDSFAFEEFKKTNDHDLLLWGNPALLVTTLACHAYRDEEWNMSWLPGGDVPELPWFVTRVDGEAVAHPCGELLISERGAERLRRLGINPILSYPNRDAVRVPGIESVGGTDWGWA